LPPHQTADVDERGTRYQITFPEQSLAQDEEWCLVDTADSQRRMRFHDYADIYALPGLYEQLFYEHLECCSPTTVVGLLESELEQADVEPDTLNVLDVGAGNGMVGEQLAEIGADTIVGVDILPEAATAVERDRPGIYEDYHVVDLTDLDQDVRGELESGDLNALTCVAALGFGDIPPTAFATAYDLLPADGWLAFSIKEDFLEDGARSGFERLIRQLVDRGMVEIRAQENYRHRLSASGEPVHYEALVASKRNSEPAAALVA
jgi:predicted TPR repeat methyltransferase